jgi:hypothetical protein
MYFATMASSSGTTDKILSDANVFSSIKMVITNVGNVGIGTTNPLYTFDVSGAGRFTNNLTV